MAEPRHAARPTRRPASAIVPVLAMATFGLFAVLAAAASVDWTLNPRFNPFDGARTYTPTPLPQVTTSDLEAPDVSPIGWTGPVFGVLMVVVGVLLAALLVRRLWRNRPRRRVQVGLAAPTVPSGAVSAEEPAEALRRGAFTALDLLDEIPDPQDAVIRSWLALEHAALSSAAPRRPSDSPTEFAHRVLAATSADADSVRRLLGLYQRARFSEHPVGVAEVRQARECVLRLSRSLAGYETALRRSVRDAGS